MCSFIYYNKEPITLTICATVSILYTIPLIIQVHGCIMGADNATPHLFLVSKMWLSMWPYLVKSGNQQPYIISYGSPFELDHSPSINIHWGVSSHWTGFSIGM